MRYEGDPLQLTAWQIRCLMSDLLDFWLSSFHKHRNPDCDIESSRTWEAFEEQDLHPGVSVSIACALKDKLEHSCASRVFLLHPRQHFFVPSTSKHLREGATSLYLPTSMWWDYKKVSSDPLFPSSSSCVHFACEATDCPELAVKNASLNCSSSDHYHSTQCTVSCRTGYVLQIQRDDELIKTQVCSGVGLRASLQSREGCWDAERVFNCFNEWVLLGVRRQSSAPCNLY